MQKKPYKRFNPNVKLTAEQVISIRAKLRKGVSLSVLAREFSTSTENIRGIQKRRTWKHLEETYGKSKAESERA